MSPEELEKLAAKGSEMPDGLTAPEQLLFLSLRQLYAIYRSGRLPKDIAKAEKTKIYQEYAQNVLNHKCWVSSLERQRKLSYMIQDIRKCDCETCKKVLRIVEGI